MKAKIFFHTSRRIIGTTRLYATAFGSITPLLQPDHFKYHGYSPDEGPNLDLTDDAELEATK